MLLSPVDTVVACSTPAVAELYRRLGYRIAGVEGTRDDHPAYPWSLLERLTAGDEGLAGPRPDDPTRVVRVRFRDADVSTAAVELESRIGAEIAAYLDGLPVGSRAAQFRQDFRRHAGADFDFTVIGEQTIELTAGDAMELLSKVNYTGNWLSETHEQFFGLTWSGWVELVTSLEFTVDVRSGAWRNDWLVEHRFAAVADLLDPDGQPLAWPVTHLLLVARQPPQPETADPPSRRHAHVALKGPLDFHGDMRMSPGKGGGGRCCWRHRDRSMPSG